MGFVLTIEISQIKTSGCAHQLLISLQSKILNEFWHELFKSSQNCGISCASGEQPWKGELCWEQLQVPDPAADGSRDVLLGGTLWEGTADTDIHAFCGWKCICLKEKFRKWPVPGGEPSSGSL